PRLPATCSRLCARSAASESASRSATAARTASSVTLTCALNSATETSTAPRGSGAAAGGADGPPLPRVGAASAVAWAAVDAAGRYSCAVSSTRATQLAAVAAGRSKRYVVLASPAVGGSSAANRVPSVATYT